MGGKIIDQTGYLTVTKKLTGCLAQGAINERRF